MLAAFAKTPAAVLDYEIDWSAWLASGGDSPQTIALFTWTVPAGLTKLAEESDAAHTRIRLSGGTVGATYAVGIAIETSTGQVQDESFTMTIQPR